MLRLGNLGLQRFLNNIGLHLFSFSNYFFEFAPTDSAARCPGQPGPGQDPELGPVDYLISAECLECLLMRPEVGETVVVVYCVSAQLGLMNLKNCMDLLTVDQKFGFLNSECT